MAEASAVGLRGVVQNANQLVVVARLDVTTVVLEQDQAILRQTGLNFGRYIRVHGTTLSTLRYT